LVLLQRGYYDNGIRRIRAYLNRRLILFGVANMKKLILDQRQHVVGPLYDYKKQDWSDIDTMRDKWYMFTGWKESQIADYYETPTGLKYQVLRGTNLYKNA